MSIDTAQVDAVIAGTQKGGTTALFSFLAQHAAIGVPVGIKELHFFDNDAAFADQYVDYDNYHRHFSHAQAAKVWLEATPIYMYWQPAPGRLARYNPRMKLILILRDPVERALSQWRMEFGRGLEAEDFPSALAKERELRAVAPGTQDRVRSYIDRGFYGRQVARLLEFFAREQVLFLKREDLLLQHKHTLDAVCEFLRVRAFECHPEPSMVFPVGRRLDLPWTPPSLLEELRAYYHDDLVLLEALSGLDLRAWRQ